MASFYFVVATLPFALYLLALALIYSRRSPRAVDGKRDFIATSLALIGFFFIGPGQVLAPWGACAVWKSWVWLLVGAFYFLVCAFASSAARQKIVAYNAPREALRKALTTTALALDEEARWCGDAMNLPNFGVQFFLDYTGFGRVATLVRFGENRSAAPWKRLTRDLSAQLKTADAASRRAWFPFALVGGGLLGADVALVFQRAEEIRSALSFYLSV